MPTQRSTGPCLEGKSRQLGGAVLMQHGGGRGAVQVREHTDCAGKAWQAHSLTCWMGGRDFCIAELPSDVLGTFPSLSMNLLSLNVHCPFSLAGAGGVNIGEIQHGCWTARRL